MNGKLRNYWWYAQTIVFQLKKVAIFSKISQYLPNIFANKKIEVGDVDYLDKEHKYFGILEVSVGFISIWTYYKLFIPILNNKSGLLIY